jgi:hypothetical protein
VVNVAAIYLSVVDGIEAVALREPVLDGASLV